MFFSKSWIIEICAVSVMSAVLMCIIPSSSIKKTYKVLVSVILIYTFLAPILSGDLPDLKNYIENIADLSEVSEDYGSLMSKTELEAAQEGLCNYLKSELDALAVPYDKIKVRCTEKNAEIVVEEIQIFSDMDEQTEITVINHINTALNIEARINIINEGEKNE